MEDFTIGDTVSYQTSNPDYIFKGFYFFRAKYSIRLISSSSNKNKYLIQLGINSIGCTCRMVLTEKNIEGRSLFTSNI